VIEPLERPRVVLRTPTPRDGPELVALNRRSRELHRGWTSPPVTLRAYEDYLCRLSQASATAFFVCRVSDGTIVGVCNVSEIVLGAFRSAYLGYYVGSPYARHGYMRAGLELVVKRAFGALKLHRVEANIQPKNLASRALVLALGFRLEGYSPRYLKIGGRWCDHERWARLADE
jgi:ribosomal-protein-alanine N-acetyltransferase